MLRAPGRGGGAYQALLVAAVVGPLLLLLAAAVWNWNRVNRDVDRGIFRTVALLHEEALGSLQTDRLILARIDDRVAGMDWPTIISQEAPLGRFLKAVTQESPDVDGAFLADATGEPQVATREYPVLARREPAPTRVNVSDRGYFQAARGGAPFTIDGPFASHATGREIFDVAMRLTSPDGTFRGVAVLTISPQHLTKVWRTLAARGDVVALVREDGTIINRYPSLPLAHDGAPARYDPALMATMRRMKAGQIDRFSSNIDGVPRRFGFAKLEGYPLFVAFGVDRHHVVQQWYPTVAAFGGLAALAMITLLMAARAVIRRARGEAAALTQAEAAAAALRESEQRYRNLYDKTPAPMHALDINGIVIAVNDRWLDLMGYEQADVLGEPVAKFLSPVSAAVLRQGGWQQSIERDEVRDLARQYIRKSGEILDVLISARVERDSDGRFLRMLSVVIDVTQQRRAEAQFRQAQKMEAVGQLTGGIAHDFNNLLTVIIGNIDALQRRLGSLGGGEPDFRRLTDAVMRAADRGAVLTQRLLAFSRRQPLAPKPTDLNRLIAGMTDLLRSTLGENIAIESILAGVLWPCAIDGNQLESALLNLAVNARDAMPKGGKLTIETTNTYLDEVYAAAHEEVASGPYVMLGVSDTGTGMGKDVIARAFEPFFTTKEIGQGTGLGLSQVYGFVKQSGGHLKIYSEVGQGTTVKLYLPRLFGSDKAIEPASAVPEADLRKSGETVLVVEDDDDVRRHSVEILRELGYRVLEASNAAAALQVLEKRAEIALLFTDVGLPGGLSGRELAAEARRRRPQLRVLFTTGYARSAVIHQGRLDPSVELIVKPFTYANLAAKIRGVLDAPGGRQG